MKYDELLTEMAFSRKRIIRALESYDARIFEHTTKILLMPQTESVLHRKRELLAWAGYLAQLRTTAKGNPPMGYDLAYEYLYRGPFVGNEEGMTAHFVRMVGIAYDLSNVDLANVHQKLQVFLTQLAHDIGGGTSVEATIESLGQ